MSNSFLEAPFLIYQRATIQSCIVLHFENIALELVPLFFSFAVAAANSIDSAAAPHITQQAKYVCAP